MNYQIIKNEQIFRDFIEWLPKLKSDEKYYLCLFARNKYCKELTHIKSDKAQLKRFTSDKERLFWKVKQLECEVGSYRQKDIPVPQEALALYITVNPRNIYKATINTMVKLANSIRDQNICMNPHQEAMSEIQKTQSRKCYVDFDLDRKAENDTEYQTMIDFIINYTGNDNFKILESRGGYHILIKPSKISKEKQKTWYNNMLTIQEVDQVGDLMIPVPGCTQGNFIPYFKK